MFVYNKNVDCNKTELYNLLKFDDTVVNVVRDHLLCMTTHTRQHDDRIGLLTNLIESACLLRQLRNFHGLQLLIGAIQSPRLYFDQDCWRSLRQKHPIHYR